MEDKQIILNEDGTLDKFCVPENLRDLIIGLDKYHEWFKKQTLTDELVLYVNFPDEGKTIEFKW